MIYIKIHDKDVRVGGTVASAAMIADGWMKYTGPIPDGDTFTWDSVNNVLVGDLTISKDAKKAELKEGLSADLEYIPATDTSGKVQMLTNSAHDQTNSLLAIAAAKDAVSAPAHSVNTTYKVNSLVSLGGVIMVAVTVTGPTAATAPKAPTKFSAHVVDGGVTWALFGLLLGTAPSGTTMFTPQDVLDMAVDATAHITYTRMKYSKLVSSLNAATTRVDIDAIKWTPNKAVQAYRDKLNPPVTMP